MPRANGSSKSAKSKTGKKRNVGPLVPFLAPALAALGIILIAVSIRINAVSGSLSFDYTPAVPAMRTNRANQPSQIDIRSVGISLPVYETDIIGGRWQVATEGVSHLRTSARPEESGNIVMYAHNETNRFAKLHDVSFGDTVRLTLGDGSIRLYTIDMIETVHPSDIRPIEPTVSETLTMYTCTGFADMKRLIVQASPVLPLERATIPSAPL